MKVSEVKYPTPIEKDMEKAIRDRLFSGFNNWNGGYDGWLKWCDTLYEPDACYNIPLRGAQKRLTLQEYKGMMGQLFQHFAMELGQFDNMIIRDDWCAIRYTVKIKNLHTGEEFVQNTMEFVKLIRQVQDESRPDRRTGGVGLGPLRFGHQLKPAALADGRRPL